MKYSMLCIALETKYGKGFVSIIDTIEIEEGNR